MTGLDKFQRIAEKVTDELPEELFERLTGGISIAPRAKLHSDSHPSMPLYVLGEYHSGGSTGRYIVLYYGSFMRTFGMLSIEELTEKLREVIRHELRHHAESLCGERGLEIEDDVRLESYRQTTARNMGAK